jgi:hypothetical protein
MRRLVLALVPLMLSTLAVAQEALPKTIADVERDEFLLGGTVLERLQRSAKEKSLQCLKAFPHEQFCACLGEQLPLVLTIAQYAAIVSTPREELDSAASSEDERKLIEVTFTAREQCARNL